MSAPDRRDLPGTTAAPRTGTALLTMASCLLLLLAAAQGYVSFRAQYTFIDHAKHAHLPSVLEALGLDTGAVIFALLALSLARRGRPAGIERFLNVACAIGSLAMNLLASDLNSPRSVTVWVLPSALYALASDRLIAVVRRWVCSTGPGAGTVDAGRGRQPFGGIALWVLRLLFDTRGTLAGLRRWVLAVAPAAPGATVQLPGHPGPRALPAGGDADDLDAREDSGGEADALAPDDDGLAPGETKRAALIRLYERCGQAGDPRYGDRAKTAEIARELARRIGYHPGTARRELARYLASQPRPAAQPPDAEPSTEEVA